MRLNRTRVIHHLTAIAALGFLAGHVDLLPDYVYARGIRVGALDRPFDLVFSSEKALLAPLVLLGVSRLYGIRAMPRETGATARAALSALLLAAAALIGPALLAGYVKVEPKWPTVIPVWSFHNLVFVCVVEELLFRNYLFEAVKRAFGSGRHALSSAVIASSFAFGLYHFRGGWVLMALATVAGAAYAFAYWRAGLLAAVLAHFGVNFIHFVLFSYPALQK